MTLMVTMTGCSPDSSTIAGHDDNRIECRVGGAAGFERICTVERGDRDDGQILVVRKPDGGFRRFVVTADGRGVAAADGAEQPEVTIVADDAIDVAIGGDVFRLPARIRQ
jgi:hypothetical protein